MKEVSHVCSAVIHETHSGDGLPEKCRFRQLSKLSTTQRNIGFKGGTSTTQSTFILNETVSYYNFNHTNVYAVFLDASKALMMCNIVNSLMNLSIVIYHQWF